MKREKYGKNKRVKKIERQRYQFLAPEQSFQCVSMTNADVTIPLPYFSLFLSKDRLSWGKVDDTQSVKGVIWQQTQLSTLYLVFIIIIFTILHTKTN